MAKEILKLSAYYKKDCPSASLFSRLRHSSRIIKRIAENVQELDDEILIFSIFSSY